MIHKTKSTQLSPAFKSAFVYLIAVVFSKGLAIITTPIFTRIMSTEQIGIVNLYNSWSSMIGAIATLSLTSGGYTISLKEFKDTRDQYVSSVLFLTSLISIFIGFIFFINSDIWSKWLGLSKSLCNLMIIGFLLSPARDFWLARQRYEYNYKNPAFVMMGTAVIASVLSIMVVFQYNRNGVEEIAEGRLFANYIILYLVDLILWLSIFIKGKTFINIQYWAYSLKLSIPLIGYSVASQILNASDRLMINYFIGKEAVGIYGTLYSVSALSLMIWVALNSSFEPYLYQNIDKANNKIKDISLKLLALYAMISVILILFAPEIVRILATNEYYEAIYIMPPIAAGIFLTSVSNLYSDILVYLNKTQFIMFSSFGGAAINVILNAILIPVFGYIIAAYTTMFAYIIMTLFLYISANRIFKEKQGLLSEIYDNKKILGLIILTIIFSLFGLFLYRYTLIRYSCILLLCIILFDFYVRYKDHKENL